MIITRLRLDGVRRHNELDIELRAGLNVVRGPNEAGKSTIQRAIEMVLFRRPTFASAELDDIRPWRQPDVEPTIEIEFEDDGRTGKLRKVFAGARGTVEMTWDGQTLNDPAVVEQQIAALTGLPSEKFLRATASIHHQELTGLSHDENTLRDRLQQSMSGADRGTQAARKKLEDVIRRYRTEGAKNPGYLKVLRTQVETFGAQVRTGESALAQLEADRRALAEARAARTQADAALAEQREGAARAERAVQLDKRATDAQRRYVLYKRAAELSDEIDALEAAHPSSVALPALRSTVEHLRGLEFHLSEMRAEMAAEPDLSAYDALSVPRWKPWLAAGVVMIVAALVAAGAGIAVGAAVPGLGGGAALLVLGGIALYVASRRRAQLADIELQNELRESEIARRLTGRAQLAEKVRQAEQDRETALRSINQPDAAAAEKLLAAEAEHTALIGSKRSEYRGHTGGDPTGEDLTALRDQAAAEADECRHTLAGMGDIGREPERFAASYSLAIQRLTPEREACFQAEANAEARVENNTVDAEQVAAAAESLGQAQEELAAAERRLRIYEDTLATLDRAEQGTMKKAARFLEQRMARDIERITGGRYRRLRVDEQTLTFTVYSAELDDWIDVRRLSQGTLDQLYLCARLGIVRQVTEPGTPPLMLDDPFVTFDDGRAERALDLLKDLASDYQVIYMTVSDRYDAAADNVVVLSAPTMRDEPEPVIPATVGAESLAMWESSAIPAATPVAAPANGTGPARPATTSVSTAAPAAPVAPLWPEERT